MATPTLGIIGGSGLYQLEGLSNVRELRVETPFGEPSDAIVEGELEGVRLLFLPRHGRGHVVPPHRINYRANVLALKLAGAEQILSVSAVGSLDATRHPGEMIVVDQFIDRTRHRADTFFDEGIVAHVGFAHPVDAALSRALLEATREAGATAHDGGTYVCMEGPQFSTRAESELYRSWGAHCIGMTNLPEARLAREAELPYATLAMVTDYDCWHPDHDAVTVEAILEVMHRNVATAKAVIHAITRRLPDPAESPATTALAGALVTDPAAIDPEARLRLDALVGRYLG